MNTYLYSGVCVFSIFHVVMIISPGHEAFDYRKAGTQHTSHEGLHMSMSTPLLLLVGAVPQFLGTVLMLRISYHISRAAKLRRAQLEGELEASEAKQTTHAMNSMSVSVSHLPGGTQSSHYHQNSHSNSGYNNGGHHVDFAFGVDFYIKQLARNYFTRWTWMTAVLVFPSFFISTLSFCLFLRGAKTPHYFGYFQATCDSLIFFTQPVNLTILWVSLVMKHLPPSENKRGNKTPMGGDTISATAALNFSGASGGGQLSRATSIKYLPLSTSMPATTAGVFINSIPHGAMVQTHGGVAHGIVYPTPPPESQFQSAGKFGVVGTSSLPQQGVYVTENGEEAIRLYQLEHQSRPQSMLSGAIMEASI
ncbi:uncharacterized protein LOC134842360 isoform X2 [Symsagittifera roscoffensis]|uniref:uncharacterized protein LOC134842360 isoform X2 n=1 Tax=Symsagittifera roscoffensis TaxID=84072 RepID=UPI00307BAF8D